MTLRPVAVLNRTRPALARLRPAKGADKDVLKARSYAYLVTRLNLSPETARQMLGLTQ